MDACVVLGAGLLVGQWARGSAAPVLAGAAVCLVLSWRRLGIFAICGFAVAAGAGVLRADRAAGTFERARSSVMLKVPHPDRCEGRVRVVSSPIWLHPTKTPGLAMGDEASAPTLSWDGASQSMACGGHMATGPVVVRLYGGPVDLGRGDEVEVVADLAPVELLRNDGVGDPTLRAARRGVVLSGRAREVERVGRGLSPGGIIDRLRAEVRSRIEATFVPRAAPLARALVLGETDLDPADDAAFRASGLSHLLAVSGTHLVLAVITVVRAIEAVLRRIERLAARFDVGRIGALFGVVLAVVYADFAGGSGSARRAAAMLSVGLLARALGRRPKAKRSFGLSVLAGALLDPLVGFDASFVLSVAATGGMMTFKSSLASALAGGSFRVDPNRSRDGPKSWLSRWWRIGIDGASTTLAASAACSPYLVLLAPSLPIGGLFANLLAVPVGELVALPLCLAHALLAPWPLVERGAAVVASGSLLVVRGIAYATTGISWLSVAVPPPTGWQLAVLAGAIVAVWMARAGGRWPITLVAAAILCLLEVAAVRQGAPRGRLRITFLDVGQGDSALLDLPSGGGMLVDGGGSLGGGVDPGAVAVAPLLRARRRRRLDVVVLSHPHPDHVGGLPNALSGIEVGEFWDNGQGETEGAGPAYDAVLADLRARGTAVRRPAQLCGKARVVGGAIVEVLSPCPGPTPFADANDNSMVLRVEFGARTAVLVGDLPSSVETELLASRPESLRADVLKVGHHGSRTSTSEAWLEAVRPRDGIISVGVRNRFGHPSIGTLKRLALGGVAVERTDQMGSVTWETDGERAWLTSTVRPRGGNSGP